MLITSELLGEEFGIRASNAKLEMDLRNLAGLIRFDGSAYPPTDFDREAATVTFTERSGSRMICWGQIIGTWVKATKTFTWGDYETSLPTAMTDEVKAFRETLPELVRAPQWR